MRDKKTLRHFFENRDQIGTNYGHFFRKSLLGTTDINRDRVVSTGAIISVLCSYFQNMKLSN